MPAPYSDRRLTRAPMRPSRAMGTVPGPSAPPAGTNRGLALRTVQGLARATCWAARGIWPYRYELGPMAAMVAAQALAARAWSNTVAIPWLVGATPDAGGIAALGIGLRPLQLGRWMWAVMALAVIGSVLAASGALTAARSRHWVTVALVLSVAEFGALSALAGWHPWSLIVGPLAAAWWALTSPAGPDSRVRSAVRQGRLVRIWRRRVDGASRGHLRVVQVIDGTHLTHLRCEVVEATQEGATKQVGAIAAGLGVSASRVSVVPDPERSEVAITITSGDPLGEPVKSTVPSIGAPPSVPFRVGRIADGSPVTVDLLGGHHLIAGRTGAGKSRALMLWLIAAANRGAALHVIDLKWGVDVRPIAGRCETVASTMDEARTVIAGVRHVMEERGQLMAARGWSDWGQCDGASPVVLGIDEAATLAADRAAWADLLEIVRKGRAAWVVVVMATQRPTGDTLPTTVTGQLGTRWLGPLTPAESDVAMLGAVASTAPHQLTERPGRAVVVRGGRGVEVQTDWLSDEAIARWATLADAPDDDGPTGLPRRQAEALAAVQQSPGVTAEQVGTTLGIDRSQASRTLRALERKGLVGATNSKPATWRATTKETS